MLKRKRFSTENFSVENFRFVLKKKPPWKRYGKVRPQPADKLATQDGHEHGHCSYYGRSLVRPVRPRALDASMGIL